MKCYWKNLIGVNFDNANLVWLISCIRNNLLFNKKLTEFYIEIQKNLNLMHNTIFMNWSLAENCIKIYNNFIISAIKFEFPKWKINSGNESAIKEKNVIACCQNVELQKLIKFNYSFWWRFFIFLVSLSFCSHSSFCELKSNEITQWQQIYLPWFEQITKKRHAAIFE